MTIKADAPARSLSLTEADPEIAQVVRNEERRQNDGLELIARLLCRGAGFESCDD